MFWASNVHEPVDFEGADWRVLLVTDLQERIVGVSQRWLEICGYTAEESFSLTPRALQGPLTDRDAAKAFASSLKAGRDLSRVSLVNYSKNKSAFRNDLTGWSHGDLLIAETRQSTEKKMVTQNITTH